MDSEVAQYDLADKTLSCGRKGDSLKLWLLLKMRGLKGMESLALEAIEKARYIEKQIRSQPDKYEMAHNPMGTNICWWYIPPALKDNYTKEMKGKVSKIIYERMSKQGTMLI